MTFALGLALGLCLGAALTLAALCALCVWLAARDDDPRPAPPLPGKRGTAPGGPVWPPGNFPERHPR